MNLSIKIKDNDQLLDANIELADGVIIVSPAVKREEKPKFEPKNGDVIVCTNEYGTYTALYKFDTGYGFAYYAILYPDREPAFYSVASYLEVRPTTEEEKKKFFDILEKNGYRWNAEEMELEKIKWEPKYEEEYCYPSLTYKNGFIVMKTNFRGSGFDVSIFNRGWMFSDEEKCQQLCDKLNQAINSSNSHEIYGEQIKDSRRNTALDVG